MTSKWLNWGRQLGYPLNTIARRIINKMKEREPILLIAFGIFLAILIQSIPDLSNWASAMSLWTMLPARFVYPIILLVIAVIAFLLAWFVITLVLRKIRAINKEAEDNEKLRLKEALTEVGLTNKGLKKAFKAALKEVEREKKQSP